MMKNSGRRHAPWWWAGAVSPVGAIATQSAAKQIEISVQDALRSTRAPIRSEVADHGCIAELIATHQLC